MNDFGKSNIILLYDEHMKLVDGSIQTPRQRLITLKMSHRNNIVLHDFLKTCKVKLLEQYPCKNRIELRERVIYHELLLRVNSDKYNDDLELKKLYISRLDMLKRPKDRKKNHIPEVSFYLDFDV